MAEGWIKLHRKICKCVFWPTSERRPFTKMEAFIDLVLRANHKEKEVLVELQKVIVSRGQLLTSEVKLSEQWKWSRNKVRRFLTFLENEKTLVKNGTTKYTLLTVVNYEFYQGGDTTDETPGETTERHQKDIRRNTNKNVKNVKNKKHYSDFVSLAEEEHKKLIDQFGEQGTRERIENLNLYKGSTGKKYASDYLTILNWERKNKTSQPKTEKPVNEALAKYGHIFSREAKKQKGGRNSGGTKPNPNLDDFDEDNFYANNSRTGARTVDL